MGFIEQTKECTVRMAAIMSFQSSWKNSLKTMMEVSGEKPARGFAVRLWSEEVGEEFQRGDKAAL